MRARDRHVFPAWLRMQAQRARNKYILFFVMGCGKRWYVANWRVRATAYARPSQRNQWQPQPSTAAPATAYEPATTSKTRPRGEQRFLMFLAGTWHVCRRNIPGARGISGVPVWPCQPHKGLYRASSCSQRVLNAANTDLNLQVGIYLLATLFGERGESRQRSAPLHVPAAGCVGIHRSEFTASDFGRYPPTPTLETCALSCSVAWWLESAGHFKRNDALNLVERACDGGAHSCGDDLTAVGLSLIHI